MRKRIGRPSPALVISLVALFVALGGTGYAAVKINGKNIKDRTIAGSKLKNQAVTSSKIRNGAITAAKIKNRTIAGSKINASTLGKVPMAGSADYARNAANVVGTNGELPEDNERTILEHGPLSVSVRCWDSDGNGDMELMAYVASAENGAWFASWVDGSNDIGPGTPEADREITLPTWITDSAGPGVGADSGFASIATANGTGFTVEVAGTSDWDSGMCTYALNATITG